MRLSRLAVGVFPCAPYEDLEVSLVTDVGSRVIPGALFVAVSGRNNDGHRFLSEAVARGACGAVVSEDTPPLPIPVFRVSDSRRAFALLCGNFYGNPANDFTVVGITGTNGKTSTAYMLDSCLRACGVKASLIGTVCTDDGGGEKPSFFTTPEPSMLHRIFAQAKEYGCTHTVMEVSSQSLDQSRVAGVEFELGIFTNLTVDHLDYHGSMQAYRDAKLKLFSQCRRSLINRDSDYAAPFLSRPEALSYSACNDADFRASRVCLTGDGVSYLETSPSGCREVFLPVRGRFNVYNSLAALAAAECLGLDLDACVQALASFPGVPGRLEAVRSDLPFRLLIDYAHTPDGLENVLRSLRETTAGKIIVVFGCGGDRDHSKRPEMGRIATQWADFALITTDNPRSEDPKEIIRQILCGVRGENYRVIVDRTQAIRAAVRLARAGDTVLLAGKGHETRQVFSHRVLRYDEGEIAREILKEEGY